MRTFIIIFCIKNVFSGFFEMENAISKSFTKLKNKLINRQNFALSRKPYCTRTTDFTTLTGEFLGSLLTLPERKRQSNKNYN